MNRLAFFPGSFDPVTLGHVDLAKRIADLFGECRVVVMNNREKQYLFSLEERYALCRAAFAADARITVDRYEGLFYEYVSRVGREAFVVKGMRDEKDFLYERIITEYNYQHGGLETLYLDAREELRNVSSSLVREKIAKKEDLSALLPEEVIKHLQDNL